MCLLLLRKEKAVEKPPQINSDLLTYLWVLGVSIWGGCVSFFDGRAEREKETGIPEKFSWQALAVKILSAAFAGLITMYLCQASNLPTAATGAIVGISAHLGTPALMKLKFIKNIIEK